MPRPIVGLCACSLLLLTHAPAYGIPNPAAVCCKSQGYVYSTKSGSAGETGICTFPDGTSCGAWAFLSGECGTAFTRCEKDGGTITAYVGTDCPLIAPLLLFPWLARPRARA